MTAVALFDLLAREEATPGSSPSPQQLTQLAEKLVAVALEDLDRVRAYESQTIDRSSPERIADLKIVLDELDRLALDPPSALEHVSDLVFEEPPFDITSFYTSL